MPWPPVGMEETSMASSWSQQLSLAETGALALADAARDLDHADDAQKFLGALDRNHRVWKRIGQLAASRAWAIPDRRMVDYALKATGQSSGQIGHDDHIHALIHINRQVSKALAEGHDIERIRERAHVIWESCGRPQGEDMAHWLIAEMEVTAD